MKKTKTKKVKSPRVAIVVSEFNPDVTGGLRNGALEVCKEEGVLDKSIALFSAPGAFELPLLAKELALSKKFDAVVCLGCVIKGDTAHFEFISLGASIGIQQVSLETRVPVAFGILTTYTDEQAILRSRADSENKGREAALAAIKTFRLQQTIRSLR